MYPKMLGSHVPSPNLLHGPEDPPMAVLSFFLVPMILVYDYVRVHGCGLMA